MILILGSAAERPGRQSDRSPGQAELPGEKAEQPEKQADSGRSKLSDCSAFQAEKSSEGEPLPTR